jgi:hypothetical protein
VEFYRGEPSSSPSVSPALSVESVLRVVGARSKPRCERARQLVVASPAQACAAASVLARGGQRSQFARGSASARPGPVRVAHGTCCSSAAALVRDQPRCGWLAAPAARPWRRGTWCPMWWRAATRCVVGVLSRLLAAPVPRDRGPLVNSASRGRNPLSLLLLTLLYFSFENGAPMDHVNNLVPLTLIFA